ncbi:MAG: peptidylprolyl isomerase [Alphaproteobacteria bacterium]
MASVLTAQGAAALELPSGLDPENTIVMELKDGPVFIQLLPATAPDHVQRIKELTREGFYDGVIFHRVIDGFMAQTGDPTGTGTGGSDKPDLVAEFSKVAHERGTASMARAADPNSANSQFFICFQPQPGLDGQYTVWGKVVSGMEYVDKIERGEPPANPDKIIRMRVAADIQEGAAGE